MRQHLQRCGYRAPLLVEDYAFIGDSDGEEVVPLAGFADYPTDARSACIATVFADGGSSNAIGRARQLGAPYVLAIGPDRIEWWLQKREGSHLQETIAANKLAAFFEQHRDDFHPDRIFRAKTRGLFQADQQLTFVDAGLMPIVESEMGDRLSALVGRIVQGMLASLGQHDPSVTMASRVFKAAFWLLAGRMLRDKRVPDFKTLDLGNVDDVFRRVSRHYGVPDGLPPSGPRWRRALADAAADVAAFASLANVTTESLAYLYESTLVPKHVRKALGIHSTPSYLVDYMVWQMADWIEAIPPAQRHVFEPACGHGGFLVACVRLLRELLGQTGTDERKAYLRSHIHGIEVDEFAIEIARLSLTLADIPNPNGWDLQTGDMFASGNLSREAARAGVILANPPFENFSSQERQRYTRQRSPVSHINKAAEMVSRILPAMKPDAVLGLVLPQGFLRSKGAEAVRSTLLADFEIREICLFPDKVFAFADSESAIILARRTAKPFARRGTVLFQAVRERDWPEFRNGYQVTWARSVPVERFAELSSLRLPELDEVWTRLRPYQRLEEIAHVGKGMEYHGRHLPKGIQPISTHRRTGDVPGFAKVPRGWRTHEQPPRVWMTANRAAIRRDLSGNWTGQPQVIVNYAPVSRGPWRLKAAIDIEGHAITSRFLAVRPTDDRVSVHFLWALCNSPIANAFMYCHSMKRDNMAGEMRKIPVPPISSDAVGRVAQAANEYFEHMARPALPLHSEPDMQQAKQLMLAVDAEILRLYDLPPRLERQLLDLFDGHQRVGVPFTFKSYYPDGFRPFVPLHVLISDEYASTCAGELRRRATPEHSETVLAALSAAVEAFEESES